MKKWQDPLGDTMLWSVGLFFVGLAVAGLFGKALGWLAAALMLPFAIMCPVLFCTFLLVNTVGLVGWFGDLFNSKKPWHKRR